MLIFGVVFSGIAGALLASFLDVVAERAATGGSLRGRSHCPSCQKILQWWELIPIFSWLFLLGRCSACRVAIPLRHLFEEVVLAALFSYTAFVFLQQGMTSAVVLELSLVLIAFAGLALAFFADTRFSIIPDSSWLVTGAAAAGLVALRAAGITGGGILPPEPFAALVGAAGAVLLLAAFALVSRGTWMGWGDVKLAVALGLLLGYPVIIFSFAVSFMLGAFAGLLLVALRFRSLRDAIPFGPFLIVPVFVFVLMPERLIETLLAFFLFTS